jgi:hypothetical protein
MVIICLVVLALSAAAFALSLRKAGDGREDDSGFHPAK